MLQDPSVRKLITEGRLDESWTMSELLTRRESVWTWETFEYLAVIARDWEAQYPDGTYPRGMRRMNIPDAYREEDSKLGFSRLCATYLDTIT